MAEAWSYILSGKTVGPITEEALRDLLASGRLRADDLVWHQGLADWTKAGQFPELQPRPSLAPPVPAPPIPLPPPPMLDEAALDAGAPMAATLAALRATKPWVRFLGVLGIIGTIFMVLLALVFMAFNELMFRGMPPGIRMLFPVLYLIFALLQFPPVLFLNRYASRIGDLLRTGAPEDLTRAMEAQKSFWKYVGIMTLIVLCCYVLALVGGVGMALVAGGMRHVF